MVAALDTSFLFSVYGPRDRHSEAALDWLRRHSASLPLTSLNCFELLNALRFSECRGRSAPTTANRCILDFETDIKACRLTETVTNLSEVLQEARRLSAAHTLTGGHRGFDILHVAAAKVMTATHFLTFDDNQKSLAEKEGLTVPF